MNFAAPTVVAWLALGTFAALGLAPVAQAQPPAWPDEQLVANGCYISTALYLARLRETHPAIVARAENVRLPSGRLHTLALVEWKGRTFLRDMFIGVAPAPGGEVQRSFDTALAAWRAKGGRHGHRERSVTTEGQRHTEIANAARLLAPHRPRILIVLSRRGPQPVLHWQTPEGELAFYEPSTGTAVGLTQRSPQEVADQLFGAPSTLAHREIAHASSRFDS